MDRNNVYSPSACKMSLFGDSIHGLIVSHRRSSLNRIRVSLWSWRRSISNKVEKANRCYIFDFPLSCRTFGQVPLDSTRRAFILGFKGFFLPRLTSFDLSFFSPDRCRIKSEITEGFFRALVNKNEGEIEMERKRERRVKYFTDYEARTFTCVYTLFTIIVHSES